MKLLVSSSESFRGKKTGYVLNAGEKWFYLHLLGSTLLVNIPIQNRIQYPHFVFFAAWVMHAVHIYIYTYVCIHSFTYIYLFIYLIFTDIYIYKQWPTRPAPDAPRWAELTESDLGPEISATSWDMFR